MHGSSHLPVFRNTGQDDASQEETTSAFGFSTAGIHDIRSAGSITQFETWQSARACLGGLLYNAEQDSAVLYRKINKYGDSIRQQIGHCHQLTAYTDVLTD